MLWFQHKLGIPEGAHFRDVEAGELVFGRNALTDQVVNRDIHDVRHREDKADERGDPDELGYQLTGIAVEETAD